MEENKVQRDSEVFSVLQLEKARSFHEQARDNTPGSQHGYCNGAGLLFVAVQALPCTLPTTIWTASLRDVQCTDYTAVQRDSEPESGQRPIVSRRSHCTGWVYGGNKSMRLVWSPDSSRQGLSPERRGGFFWCLVLREARAQDADYWTHGHMGQVSAVIRAWWWGHQSLAWRSDWARRRVHQAFATHRSQSAKGRSRTTVHTSRPTPTRMWGVKGWGVWAVYQQRI